LACRPSPLPIQRLRLGRPSGLGEETGIAFLFRLETVDGAQAEPPTLTSAVPNWGPGNTIPLERRRLRVVSVRDDEADQPPALIVEEMA
jgi:hypothetical protein